jgi:hypothetical protein
LFRKVDLGRWTHPAPAAECFGLALSLSFQGAKDYGDIDHENVKTDLGDDR